MTDPISQTFSTIRAMLQSHDVTWSQLIDTLTTTYNALDGTQREEFRARYYTYVEEAFDARFEDWQRTLSLDQYLRRERTLHIALSRHLEVTYDHDIFIKSYFTRCDRHFSRYNLDQFTVLSLNKIGARNALHLVKLFATHRPKRLTGFGFSLVLSGNVTPRTKQPELFDALLALPDPDVLTTFAIMWSFNLSKESERNLYDALCTHLPGYTTLTTFTMAKEFKNSAHLTHLPEVIPHTVTHLSLNVQHVPDINALLAHDLFARLDTLRLGGLNRAFAKKILDDQLMLHLSHMNLSWNLVSQPWLTTAHEQGRSETIHTHDLERAAHDIRDDISLAQLNAETLSLGHEEPLTPQAFRAMLCHTDGSPRVFPFLQSLTLCALDHDALTLLMTCGALCFPRLTSLSINFDAAPETLDIAWTDAPIWRGVTYLRLVTPSKSSWRPFDSFWAHDHGSQSLFPEVTDLDLNSFELDVYTRALPVLFKKFPKLRTLGSFSISPVSSSETFMQDVFELLRTHKIFEALHALKFDIPPFNHRHTSTRMIGYWIALLVDEEIPVHLRRHIVHQLIAYTTKDDLLDHIAPAMGVTLPRSGNKSALTTRLVSSLPQELQSYGDYPAFKTTSAITLHTP